MSKPDPFLFTNPQGVLFNADTKIIMTELGMERLIKACRAKPDAAHQAAADALEVAKASALLLRRWDHNKEGDVEPYDKPEKRWDGKVHLFPECSGERRVVVVAPGAVKNRFMPNERLDFGSDARMWGWQIEILIPHASLITKVAKDIDVTFRAKTLRTIPKLRAAMEAGEISIRRPNAEVDRARAGAYVIYDKSLKGYVSQSGVVGNLSNAVTFEHGVAAQKWIGRREPKTKDGSASVRYVVFPVQVRVTSVPTDQLDPDSLIIFQEAMAQMHKEEMEQSLKDLTIEQLQARIEQISGQTTTPSAKTKRM